VSDEKLPYVDLKLVEYLGRIFPNKLPAIDVSERELWASVGAQRVIAKLQAVANSQHNNILDREVLYHNG
jgi:hypothetical protein